MLTVKALNDEQIDSIYQNHMIEDFPDNELKPLNVIKSLRSRGLYHAYGLFDHDTVRGYAFFSTAGRSNSRQNCLLLDYFAIIAGGRSRGYGSKFLKLLKPRLTTDFPNSRGMIAEVESVRAATNQTEKHLRERRIAFYRRNGFRRTRIRSNLFGVDFTILFQSYETEAEVTSGDSFVIDQMHLIYAAMLPARIREQEVKLWLKPVG